MTSPTRSRQRQRTLDARSAERRHKAWAAEVGAIKLGGLFWRAGSTWIDQAEGAYCAEFIHVGNGRSRTVKLCPVACPTPEVRATTIIERLSVREASV